MLLLPWEVIEVLTAEGWPVQPGDLGENITTRGIPNEAFRVGDRWQLGEVVVQISKPCTPCEYLEGLPYVGPSRGARFRATLVGRRGWFARVLRGGRVRPTDPVSRVRAGGSLEAAGGSAQ